MTTMPIDINLSVESKNESLIASLLFFNNTPTTWFLDRFSIGYDGQFYRNNFKIVDELGRELKYTGVMVKRLVAPEHFVPLETGAMMKTTIVLNNGYPLKQSITYTIKYTVNNPGYSRGQDMMVLQSNAVEVKYD